MVPGNDSQFHSPSPKREYIKMGIEAAVWNSETHHYANVTGDYGKIRRVGSFKREQDCATTA